MKPAMQPALAEALALARSPRSRRPGAQARLPDGILLLLKLAAGEDQALEQASESTGESPATLREAAVFYVQQVMFATGSNSYRVLGVDPDAPDERMREHYRWLARWLHPDRNTDGWDAVYAERVNSAWQDLRSQERRLRYDQSTAAPQSAPDVQYRQRAPFAPHPVFSTEQPLAPRLRWLPATILSGLGVAALGTVLLFSALTWTEAVDDAAPAHSVATTAVPAPAVVDPAEPPVEPPAAQMEALLPPRPETQFAVSTTLPVPAANPTPPTSSRVREDVPATPSQPHLPSAPKLEPDAAPVARTPAARPNIEPPSIEHPDPKTLAKTAPVSAREEVPVSTSRESPNPESPAPTNQLDQRDANRILGNFSRAYSDGNLADMRAMFASDIQSPSGGMDVILGEYDQLFSGSLDRSLAVRDVSWFANGGTLTIIARYQASVASGKSRRPRITHGDLRMDLRREDNQWRIYRLQHAERRG